MELNSTRKGKQEELQRPGSNGGGPRRIRKISPQQRQDRKFQIKKDTKHRPVHTQHTQELNELQIAQHLHHLTTTHLQVMKGCQPVLGCELARKKQGNGQIEGTHPMSILALKG